MIGTSTFAANLSDVIIDPYGGHQSPANCTVLKFFTVYAILMFGCSLLFNSLLLFAFFKNKEVRSPVNMFILALTVCNLFATLSESQFIIPSTYACRWVHGKAGCYISGFIMYTVGLLQINLATAISIERYFIIYKPLNIKSINYQSTGMVIAGCVGFSLLFTIAPLLGWSRYSLESSLIQCGVEWAERSWNVQSYNMVIFFFNFVLPIGAIGYCSFHLIKIIKEMPNMAKDDEKAKQRIANERQLTINMLIYLSGFCIAWTPYTVASLMSAFFGHDAVSALGSFIPAMFAKTSMAWGAMFFVFTNKQIRATIFGAPSSAPKGVSKADSEANA